MFYQTLSWWILLGVGFIFSLLMQVGHYGRGRSSRKIEAISGIAILIISVICFIINGIWAGIVYYLLQGVFAGINQSLAKRVLLFLAKL